MVLVFAGECPVPECVVVEGSSTFLGLGVGVWERVARENVETPNSSDGRDGGRGQHTVGS